MERAPRAHGRPRPGRIAALALVPLVLGSSPLVGCAPGPLRLPDTEAASVAMIMEGRPRTAALASYDAAQAALAVTARDPDETLHLLTFAEPLEALGLVAGTYADAPSDRWSRALPTPTAVFEGGWSDDTWSAVDGKLLTPFLLAVESPVACAGRGGCFTDPLTTVCTVPCPTPEDVTPPEPPRPLQYRPCPAGWVDDAAAQACRPWSITITGTTAVRPPPAPCPAGQLRLPGEDACRAPGPACAADWRADLVDGDTTFVRAGAAGGSGTRAAPLGSLEAALAAGRPVIALARGSYAAPARMVSAARVVGACATDTVVESTGALTVGGGLALESLLLRARAGVRVEGAARLRALHQDGPAELSSGAALVAEDVVIDGGARDALALDADGRVQVRGSRLTSQAVALSAVRTASITVLGSLLEGGRSALTATTAQITLRETVARSARGPVVAAHFGDLGVDHVLLLPEAGGYPLVATGEAVVALRRSVVSGAPGPVLIELGARARIEDVRFDDIVYATTMISASNATLEVRRVSMGTGYQRALLAEGSGGVLVMEDLAVPMVHAASVDMEGSSIRLVRVRLREYNVVHVYEPRGGGQRLPVVIEDVDITRGSLIIRGEGLVRIARFSAKAPKGMALLTRPGPQPPTIEAIDVRVEDARPDEMCGSDPLCSGSAVYIEDGSLLMERFRLVNGTGPAITVQHVDASVRARNGVIEGRTAVGLGVVDPVVLRDLLEGVELRGVSKVCEPCGVAP